MARALRWMAIGRLCRSTPGRSMPRPWRPSAAAWWSPCSSFRCRTCESRLPGRCRGPDAFGHGAFQVVDALAGDARNLEEREAALLGQVAQTGYTLGVLGGVHLGRDHDHGFGGQVVAEAGEFFHHGFEILHRVAAGGIGNVYQVSQQAGALDVAEELNAEAVTEVRAFDQAGNIGDHEAAEIRELGHAEVGFKRGEGVVGDFGPRGPKSPT